MTHLSASLASIEDDDGTASARRIVPLAEPVALKEGIAGLIVEMVEGLFKPLFRELIVLPARRRLLRSLHRCIQLAKLCLAKPKSLPKATVRGTRVSDPGDGRHDDQAQRR